MVSTGSVHVYGESWCRRTETIDEEIPISFVDQWFRLRRQQLDIGSSPYAFTVHEGSHPVPPERQDEWDNLDEQLEVIEEPYSWEIISPLREASVEDIDSWFITREFAACAEESAIGIALRRKRAGKLYHSVAHWEHEFDDDDEEEEQRTSTKVSAAVISIEEAKPRHVRLED